MTDARLPERLLTDRRVRRLSDAAYRLYVNGLLWSVSNRTDGVIHADELRLVPDVDEARADELVKAELWRRRADRWLIVDYEATQTSKHELEVLENARRREREKKARQRAAAAAAEHVPGDSPGGTSRGTAQEGQERQERQASTEGELAGTGAHEICAAPGCDRPARRSCATCADHMRDEMTYRESA